MAKRSIGMVLAPQYSDNPNPKKGKDNIEIVRNWIEFPFVDQAIPNSLISTTWNDLSNWSRLSSLWPLLFYFYSILFYFYSILFLFYMVPVLFYSISILYGTSCCFIMVPVVVSLWYQLLFH
uniref:NADH-plastoquinone oxidoreductase subunit K n=1 Tax=Enhalus acoroides TaxID=55455 RepID=A0A6M3QH53_9LILI|nr:NADH-plastoquinone oxidoreductase subunit K [Enhalus acoroides]QJC59078.1 NADH-plastoquinone oxidoreductase subunit K [Enhalus acoroides]QNH93460.1 NADH-plastoquinone oxidoreductase subunit K [Enhalus acoroides]